MKPIIVVPFGLCVQSSPQRSIDAFAKLGISKLALLWCWYRFPFFLSYFQKTHLPSEFDKYREGKISTVLFRKLAGLFGVHLADEAFDAAWNAQCILTPQGKKTLDEVNELVKRGFEVYLISSTNPLHVAHIEKQYGKPLPGVPYFSFMHNKIEIDLSLDLIAQLKGKYPHLLPNDVKWLYSQPQIPHALMGRFRWLKAPFQSWFFHRAQRVVMQLRERLAGRVTLVDHQFQKESLLTKLNQRLSLPRAIRQKKGALTAVSQNRSTMPSLKQQARSEQSLSNVLPLQRRQKKKNF